MQSAINQAPEWMFKLPKSPGVVFENGTATSGDFGMADMKAKTIAYAKICTSAGGKVRSQTKVYSADNGTTTTEQSEMAIRSICPDIDISGVETEGVSGGRPCLTYIVHTNAGPLAHTVERASHRAHARFTFLHF